MVIGVSNKEIGMKRKVTSVMIGLFVAAVFGLVGCGGGGGGDASSPSGTTSADVSKYVGKYSGTYSGSDSGTWNMTASSTGVISGSGYSNLDKTTDPFSGSINSNGAFSLAVGTALGGASFTGTVDANGKIQGTWINTRTNTVGTFTGQQTEGLIPPSTGPTVTAFVIPSTSTSLTVSITSFTGTDSTGITGYFVSASATTPLSSASGWLSLTPTSFTFASTGSKTLYAWVKNAAGQVSPSKSAFVIITQSITPASPLVGTWTGVATYDSYYYKSSYYCILTIDGNNNVTGTIRKFINGQVGITNTTYSISGQLDNNYEGTLYGPRIDTGDGNATTSNKIRISGDYVNNKMNISFIGSYEPSGILTR